MQDAYDNSHLTRQPLLQPRLPLEDHYHNDHLLRLKRFLRAFTEIDALCMRPRSPCPLCPEHQSLLAQSSMNESLTEGVT